MSNRFNVLLKVIIVLLSIFFIALIAYKKWDQIENHIYENIQKSSDTGDNLYIGDEINLSGKIADNGDLLSFSHTLGTSKYGILGLKSKKIDLFKYEGEVYIKGTVSDVKNSIPVIEVENIVALDSSEELTGEINENKINSGIVYIESAGLFFEPEFFTKYKIISSDNGQINIQNNSGDTNMIIDYFNCNKQVSDKNCLALADSFAKSKETSITSPYGIEYFKLIEIQSRFFHNNDLFGYFINNLEKEEVTDLSKYIQMINNNYIEDTIKENVPSLCKDYNLNITNIKNYDIQKDGENLNVVITGTNEGDTMELKCILKINPSLEKGASLVSIKEIENSDEDTEENKDSLDSTEESEDTIENEENQTNSDSIDETNNDETSIITTNFDPNIEQFPINLEKSLKFTSKRGHTIILPSSNIVFQEFSSDEDFEQVGVSCFSRMGVIEYSNESNLETNSSIDIFECSISDNFDDSDPSIIYKQIGDRNFIIKINDASRYEFAKNIKIIINN